MNGQREHFSARFFGHGQVDTRCKACKRFEAVYGTRIVHTRTYLPLIIEHSHKLISVVVRDSHCVLMVDVNDTRGDRGCDDAIEILIEVSRIFLTGLSPPLQFTDHSANCGVNISHAIVEAHNFVGIARLHSLIA